MQRIGLAERGTPPTGRQRLQSRGRTVLLHVSDFERALRGVDKRATVDQLRGVSMT
jgi:hypothetical protein